MPTSLKLDKQQLPSLQKEINLNQYLTCLLSAIKIDINHLTSIYLTKEQQKTLNQTLTSKEDFERDFYTDSLGANLECLLFFLTKHKDQIQKIMEGKGTSQDYEDLYKSPIISGNYDCFRFNLINFTKTYKSTNQPITLYRIGRDGESTDSLGSSWSTNIEGLKAYYQASGLSEAEIMRRPVFSATVNDSEVLFKGSNQECELVLKPEFKCTEVTALDAEAKKMLFN